MHNFQQNNGAGRLGLFSGLSNEFVGRSLRSVGHPRRSYMSIAAPLSATIQGIIARRSAPTPVGLKAERRCGAQGAISMSEAADNILMKLGVFPSDHEALAHAAVFAAELGLDEGWNGFVIFVTGAASTTLADR